MPRANRYHLPGQVWHLTHRCHKKEFLLKFAKDRSRWRYWLYESRKRYGLSVLNYIVTSNHIHLLVRDHGRGEIAKSMQLIAGRTAQEFNRRKNRRGAFWEDRYHATAVDANQYLIQCMVYVDLNMVRAGRVSHPVDWKWSGYCEIQNPPLRYKVLDMLELAMLFGVKDIEQIQRMRADWVDAALLLNSQSRNPLWTESVAVGEKEYVEKVNSAMRGLVDRKKVAGKKGSYRFGEPEVSYRAVLVQKGISKRRIATFIKGKYL